MSKDEVKTLYNLITELYPLKNIPKTSKIKNIKDIYKLRLSHFIIINSYDLSKSIDLNNVSRVYVNSKWISSITYKKLVCCNMRYRDLNYFMKYKNYVPMFNLPNMKVEKICKNNEIKKVEYIDTSIVIYKSSLNNDFIFNSLDIGTNKKNIYKELNKLIKYRDRYKTLNLYLYEGGDITISCFILLILYRKREKWMKNFKIIDTNYCHIDNITYKKTLITKEYNLWEICKKDTCKFDYCRFKQLKININKYCLYKHKYKGKIILHVNYLTASSSWYLITYLIYAFAKKIIRKTININGIFVKIGYVISDKIEIRGFSSTTSGDSLGESKYEKKIKLFGKKFNISIPTKIFLEDSVKKIDYNRFWIENPSHI